MDEKAPQDSASLPDPATRLDAGGLGDSIDRLFATLEGRLGSRPAFPESVKRADLLDDVEIRPVGDADGAEIDRALRELEEEILLEAAASGEAGSALSPEASRPGPEDGQDVEGAGEGSRPAS